MAVCEFLRCPGCGLDKKAAQFGLTPSGKFDPLTAQPNELTLRRTTIGGRGKCSVERFPVSAEVALGMRDMLKYRLAQIEADLLAAGVEIPD